ncbi:Meiotically up-regulated protein 154 protein [Sphaceloma murrayae]|uniref:Meiotically up-regulated protein 154 protein n=1 Tax=Sphaceloma murrayae TaxID=2082308 RepID=A0A2K1QMC9_9PEZI|nr:Meiotically up-regulated protein 154 protein [Sphaceloma murrayae]
MPRLVRRQPLSERIKSALDPYDFLLWLAEELHDSTWDDALKDWTLPIGAALNFILVIARSNSGAASSTRSNDVFGDFDGRSSSGWFTWLCSFTSHLLALLAFLNAVYTFFRRRHYRLFESSLEQPPSTPSARRVNVDSSPASSSPISYLTSLLKSPDAKSRAHPDQKRDVWEISVWDPKDVNLEIFTLFSPGHVLIYWLFLPTQSSDPRPSVTVVTSILLSALLSVQLVALRKSFTQQARDLKIINKEVMNEYDTKFVHPTLNPPVRDVGTQTRESASGAGTQTREVDVYTPTTIINRGFQINPNPSYVSHLSDESIVEVDSPSFGRIARSTTTPNLFSPINSYTITKPQPSPHRSIPDLRSPTRQPVQRPVSPTRGDGGSLGVYTHAASPLKKAASSSHLRPVSRLADRAGRTSSPLKRMSTPGDTGRSREDRLSTAHGRESRDGREWRESRGELNYRGPAFR